MEKVKKKVGKVNFVPAENKLLLRESNLKKSAGGVILADEEGSMLSRGTVFASSAEGYEPADTVLYNKHAVMEIRLEEGKFLICSKEAVVGKIPA